MVDYKEMYGPPHMTKEPNGGWAVPYEAWSKFENPDLQYMSHVRLYRFAKEVAESCAEEEFDEEEFKRLELGNRRPWTTWRR